MQDEAIQMMKDAGIEIPPARGPGKIYTWHEDVYVELIPGTNVAKLDRNGMPIFTSCEVTVSAVPTQDHVGNSTFYHVVVNGQQMGGTRLIELMHQKHPSWFKPRKPSIAPLAIGGGGSGPSCFQCMPCCSDLAPADDSSCGDWCTNEDGSPASCPAPANPLQETRP